MREGMTGWFKVHLRNGTDIVAEGEVERDRLMARKTPKAISWSIAKVYECYVCHTRAAWQEGWSWFGSYAELDEGEVELVFCSSGCRLIHSDKTPDQPSGLTWRERNVLHRLEPLDETDRSATYRSQQQRKRDMHAHRRFEMPKHAPIKGLAKNEGQCRWCGERITGKYAHQRSWHRKNKGDARDCFEEWSLHTDTDAQYRFLMARDGPGCADCGRGEGRWVRCYETITATGAPWMLIAWSVELEVDHETPLYLSALLDDPVERRALHHPLNLKLRCKPCHHAKSAREAADRARRR